MAGKFDSMPKSSSGNMDVREMTKQLKLQQYSSINIHGRVSTFPIV